MFVCRSTRDFSNSFYSNKVDFFYLYFYPVLLDNSVVEMTLLASKSILEISESGNFDSFIEKYDILHSVHLQNVGLLL